MVAQIVLARDRMELSVEIRMNRVRRSCSHADCVEPQWSGWTAENRPKMYAGLPRIIEAAL